MRKDGDHVVCCFDQSASFRIFDSAFYFPRSAIPHFTHSPRPQRDHNGLQRASTWPPCTHHNGYTHLPFSPKFLMGFCSDGHYECSGQIWSPYLYPFPRLGAIVSGTGEATDFKFGQNNNRVHPNKRPLKIWLKRKRGRIQVCTFLGYPLLSQERVKLRTSNFACILMHFVHESYEKLIKILEKRERGHIQGLPKFWRYPQLSQERVKLRTSNLAGAGTFRRSIRTKAHYNFWSKGSVGVSRDCPIFLGTPIISWTVKATKFKLCTHIHGINRFNRKKSPLKISGKVAVGVVSASRNFSWPSYIGRIARSSLRWLSFLVIDVTT